MRLLKGVFKFVIGFGCTAFFLYWILSKFMQVGGGMGVAILLFSILVGISSAVEKEDGDEKES